MESEGDDAATTTSSVGDAQRAARVDTLVYVTDGILTNVVVLAGLLANALTLVVLSRPSMHSSTNSYLSALAVCDSVVLTCSALLIGVPALPTHLVGNYVDGGPYAYVLAYVYPLALAAQTATVWLTVSFAVERYIGVQYPLRAATLCTVERARSANVCIVSPAVRPCPPPAINRVSRDKLPVSYTHLTLPTILRV